MNIRVAIRSLREKQGSPVRIRSARLVPRRKRGFVVARSRVHSRRGTGPSIPCPPGPQNGAHTKRRRVHRFFLQNYGRRIQQIGDFSCYRGPSASPSGRDTRGKALLMRSLIRSIERCFAGRSDVYPSRSATTRCVSSPQHAAKRTLSLSLRDHRSPPDYLNVTFSFLIPMPLAGHRRTLPC